MVFPKQEFPFRGTLLQNFWEVIPRTFGAELPPPQGVATQICCFFSVIFTSFFRVKMAFAKVFSCTSRAISQYLNMQFWTIVAFLYRYLCNFVLHGPGAATRRRGGTSGSNRGPAPRTWGGYAQKGRNRWFQQRPRSNDHGAASHCAICLQRHRGPNNFLQAGLYFLLPFGVDFFEPSGVAKI